ncbi:glycosyltransferase family 2 protein [Candidatus Woesebacteria bacterium]|nr:glycosyltransferase family 2 protein [Candidatus Woesebacteria bacterium]
MKHAVVIIPTYNESGTIEKTLGAVLEVYKNIHDWKMSILVVDDTSPDKTYELVAKIAEKKSQVNLLVNKEKSGLGGAYLKGMEYAFNTMGADVVFEFDADLSHDPTKIPLFLKSIDAGSDMVLGSRYVPGGSIPADWGLHRKILSVGANLIIMFVFADFKIRDWTSGYRAITKKVYQAVRPELESDQFSGYAFQIGFLYHAQRKGFKIDPNIPYHFVDRTVGESKIGPEYIKNTLVFIFKMRIEEILKSKIFKFAMTGGIGALIQLITLQLFWKVVSYQLASFLSIEVAILSNFIINNAWTFSDKKITLQEAPAKFIQFNLASAGSIIIQLLIALMGKQFIGLFTLFTVPYTSFAVNTGSIFAVVGILVGMVWNFFAYTKFIWKK